MAASEERSGAGSFAGRGPRDYRRSDASIRDDVCEALTRHPDIDATDVLVMVTDGEVILSGSVHEREDRALAEEVAEETRGVLSVMNDLKVIRAPEDPLEHESGDL